MTNAELTRANEIIGLIVSLALSIARVSASEDDERFQKLATEYIEQHLQTHPEDATELGDHRFDDQLTDYSHAAHDKMPAAQKQFRVEVAAIDAAKLSGPNNVDLRILIESIDNRVFELEQLNEADWNTLLYNQSLANSLRCGVGFEQFSRNGRLFFFHLWPN